MAFDKTILPFETSLARQISKQHLANFNNVFWVGERSFNLVRRSYSTIKMPTPGPGVHGYFGDASTWEAGVDEYRIWTRQHVLVSAASLLEVYVQSAGIAALYSEPNLIDRSLIGADALKFIKFPETMPRYLKDLIKNRVDSFTLGRWTERFHRLSLVFGSLDSSLLDLSNDLQSIQDRRNRIAHSYGMGGELRKTPWEAVQAISVTPKQIVDAIKVVSQAIRMLDTAVFGPHIGGYEMVHEYDVWTRKRSDISQLHASGQLNAEFRNHIGKAFGRTPGGDYVNSLIDYYNRL